MNNTDDESPDDLTPYDLAERLVLGLDVTSVGVQEVARELLRIAGRPCAARVTRVTHNRGVPEVTIEDADTAPIPRITMHELVQHREAHRG